MNVKKLNKRDIKIVFFGTSRFSVLVLEKLLEHRFPPTLIVTTPDKPQGRKLLLTPPPIKLWAVEHAIDIIQPEKLDRTFIEKLTHTDWHLFIVASYGKIIPKALLDLPKHGTLNVHPSLLPRWRGASPIQAAILNDSKTGVTIMLTDEELDHGPIVAQARIELPNLPDGPSADKAGWPPNVSVLSDILATKGGQLLSEIIPDWISGKITPEEQKHKRATYAKKITKEEGLVDLNASPEENYRKIQAFDTWPGTYFITKRNGKDVRVKISEAILKNGTLKILRVIPESKREMDYADFLRG